MSRPRVEVARVAGACFGVERALGMAEEAARVATNPVRTLGPLIHNPRVVADLGRAGVSSVDDIEQAEGMTLILRTHGSTPAEEELARELCDVVIDATCPLVKRVHAEVERMAADDRRVIVVGEAGHPEVRASLSHAEGSLCLGSPEEAASLELGERVGIVAQTTLAQATFEACCEAICARVGDVEISNTICRATSEHQGAAAELAARADVMLVVGGRNSANTRHLADICAEACGRVLHFEDASEIEAECLEDAQLIGITAGASTPAAHIEEVVARVVELAGAERA